jgi:hypothetical protein
MIQTRLSAFVPALAFAVPLALSLGLSGCAQKEAAPVAAEQPQVPYRPTSSIQDLMLHVVDPNVDVLWESVAVISTEQGIEERQPRTNEDWATLRTHAVALAESANLLMIPGRKVAQADKRLQDEGTPGTLTVEEIQKLIDGDHVAFASRALALHDAALAALKAIDEKNVQALSDVGGVIDEACENCHTRYWYPTAEPAPGSAPAEATASSRADLQPAG